MKTSLFKAWDDSMSSFHSVINRVCFLFSKLLASLIINQELQWSQNFKRPGKRQNIDFYKPYLCKNIGQFLKITDNIFSIGHACLGIILTSIIAKYELTLSRLVS